MNKSKIEWCDHTWNPITGCRHSCDYCYAARMSERFAGDVRYNLSQKESYTKEDDIFILEEPFVAASGGILAYPFGFEPTFHRYRLGEGGEPYKLKFGRNIFVGAMSDIFGTWIPDGYIESIFETCRTYEIHNYLFLTKNPERYERLAMVDKLPAEDNMWYGSTITRNDSAYFDGVAAAYGQEGKYNTFLSVEPLLEDLDMFDLVKFKIADWIIIGAETGRKRGKVVPELGWIERIVEYCRDYGIPVFMKNSLSAIVGEKNMIQEYPKGLAGERRSLKVHARLTGECMECKAQKDKADMIALGARSKRGEYLQHIGYLCNPCFRRRCNQWGIAPKMARYKHNESD